MTTVAALTALLNRSLVDLREHAIVKFEDIVPDEELQEVDHA